MKYFIIIIYSVFQFCFQKTNQAVSGAEAVTLIAAEGRGVLGLDLRVGNMGWTRGCETRMGNLIADAFAWKSGADIGFINGGAVRHDRGVDLIAKGTVLSRTQLDSFMPFSNTLIGVNLNGYRLKQALEGSVNKLQTGRTALSFDDNDSDGPQHGNCYGTVGDLDGSGRILLFNSRWRVEINPANSAQTITGTASDKSLKVASEGRRVTGIYFDGRMIYSNSSGDPASGWGTGKTSCTVKGSFFSLSQACSFYSTVLSDFYAGGGDENPSFNSELAEIANDGTSVGTGKTYGVDKNAILEYIINFSTYYPRISGRLVLP